MSERALITPYLVLKNSCIHFREVKAAATNKIMYIRTVSIPFASKTGRFCEVDSCTIPQYFFFCAERNGDKPTMRTATSIVMNNLLKTNALPFASNKPRTPFLA